MKTELEETREKRRTVSKRVKDIRDKYFDFRQVVFLCPFVIMLYVIISCHVIMLDGVKAR